MLLELPKKGESITIKIIGKVETKIGKKGEKWFVCPCKIWCDPNRKPEQFMLRLNGLWNLIETYQQLEELVGEEYKLDKDLLRIVGDIFTIKCIDNVKDKDTGKTLGDYSVELREDLKEIDSIGSPEEIFKTKKDDYYSRYECVARNMKKVYEGWDTDTKKETHGIIRLGS